MAMLGALCACCRPQPIIILEHLNTTLHWNENITSLEIEVLTQIQQSEIRIYCFDMGSDIVVSKCLVRQKNGGGN